MIGERREDGTSPAPWKRKVLSDSAFPVILMEDMRPLTVTAAVPENNIQFSFFNIIRHCYIYLHFLSSVTFYFIFIQIN